jgi:hypothetical protein
LSAVWPPLGVARPIRRQLFKLCNAVIVRGQAEDSRKARVNHDELDEELSEQEGRLAL